MPPRSVLAAAVLLGFVSAVRSSADERASAASDARRARQHHERGRDLMSAERFADAAQEFRQAIRLDRRLLMAHYDLGQAYMALREFGAAVTAFSSSRDVFQELAADLVEGSLEAQQAREDRVRDLRDDVRQLQQQAGGAGGADARRIQMEVARKERIIDDLERMRGRGSTPPETPAEISLALGSAYLRAGKADDAEREYKRALVARPGMGEAHSNLAALYLMAGRPADAKEQVKLAEKGRFRVNAGLKKAIEKALARQD